MIRDKEKKEVRQDYGRREFFQATALLLGSVGASSACGRGSERESGQSEELREGASKGLSITATGYKYPRVEALFDGRVGIEGCETQFKVGKIGDMNTHVFSGSGTVDLTEIGLHPFMLAYANDGFRDYTLLPIFPLRVFRHKSVFIRTDRGIEKPEDLRGKTIATPGYASTSLTWIRGIFQEEYGITPQDVEWITSAKDSSASISGKVSKQESMIPEGISIRSGTSGKDESDLLESGEADALFHAVQPRAFVQGDPKVARLFPDSRRAEQTYYAKTGIFPIMHAVAIKKELLQQHPWLTKAVFKAYSQAKQLAYDDMAKMGWANDMLPWYGQELEETRALLGDNFYSYGIQGNRKTLEALFRYSHQQGLSSRELTIEELFEPASLELVESMV